MEILSLPENEPFITGIEESIDICSNQIMKLADASIFHCRSGKAHIEIDLQAYEVTENTQLLLPAPAMILPFPILFFPTPFSGRSPHVWIPPSFTF
jgi:hypothetical protein